MDCFASLAMTNCYSGAALQPPSFRDGPKDQTRNLEIPGSCFARPGMTENYNGAALSRRALDSFATSEATTITTAISAITSVQMALISGLTPSRTSE
jgi:hypothetical protein